MQVRYDQSSFTHLEHGALDCAKEVFDRLKCLIAMFKNKLLIAIVGPFSEREIFEDYLNIRLRMRGLTFCFAAVLVGVCRGVRLTFPIKTPQRLRNGNGHVE